MAVWSVAPPERQCTAHSRTHGGRCRAWQVTGRMVCYHHGGRTPRGALSPHFSTGRYSKVLPQRLAAEYESLRSDPQLLELKDAIALVDARLLDLLRRVDTGEAGALWRELQRTLDQFTTAQAKGSVPEMQGHLSTLQRLIQQGSGDYAAWAEVLTLIEQRRKLSESETKRLKDAHDMLSSDQALAMIGAIVAIVQRHVTSRVTQAAIAEDIQTILLERDGAGHYRR